MRTLCRDCIFASFEKGVQQGCTLGRIEKFKDLGTDVSMEKDTGKDKQYYVINDRYCMACRNEKWLCGLDETTDHVQVMKKEMCLQYTAIVFLESTLNDLDKTLRSLNAQNPKPKNVKIVRKPSCDYSLAEVAEVCEQLETQWTVRNFLSEFSDNECTDLILRSNTMSAFYCVFYAGFQVPADTMTNVNDFVNEELQQFAILLPDKEGNGKTVQTLVHRMCKGNSGEDLEKKMEKAEWKNKILTMKSVSPSFPE